MSEITAKHMSDLLNSLALYMKASTKIDEIVNRRLSVLGTMLVVVIVQMVMNAVMLLKLLGK